MRSWFVCKKPGHEANNSQSAQSNGLNIIHLFKCLAVKSGCYLRLYEASSMHKHVQSRVDHTNTIYLCYLRLFLRYESKNEMSHYVFLWFWFSLTRSPLFYQGPLLLSRLLHRSRIEPGTFRTALFFAPFRLACRATVRVLHTYSKFRSVAFAVFSCRLKRSNSKPCMKCFGRYFYIQIALI